MTHPLVTSLRHTTLVYVGLLTNKPLCVRRPLHCNLTVHGTLTGFGMRNSGDGKLSTRGCKLVLRYIGRHITRNAWSSTACWLTQRKTTTRLRLPIAKMTKNNYLTTQETSWVTCMCMCAQRIWHNVCVPGGHGTTYVCPVYMAQRMCARWIWHNVCVPGGHSSHVGSNTNMATKAMFT